MWNASRYYICHFHYTIIYIQNMECFNIFRSQNRTCQCHVWETRVQTLNCGHHPGRRGHTKASVFRKSIKCLALFSLGKRLFRLRVGVTGPVVCRGDSRLCPHPQVSSQREGMEGPLMVGSPMSPVDSKKWQCPLSLYFRFSCRLWNSPMSPVDFKKWQFPLRLYFKLSCRC